MQNTRITLKEDEEEDERNDTPVTLYMYCMDLGAVIMPFVMCGVPCPLLCASGSRTNLLAPHPLFSRILKCVCL